MPNEGGLLARLLVRLTAQFSEDWLGFAGRRFRSATNRLSAYNQAHLKLGEKAAQTPSLLWKAAEGATSAQHAKAEADYAKAENDRMETEMKRRTMQARARHETADADKAEAEAGIARVREIQARLELFKELGYLGVSVTLDAGLNLRVAPARRPGPLEAEDALAEDEIRLIANRLVHITFDLLNDVVHIDWSVVVGSRVSENQEIGLIQMDTSPANTFRVRAPATGTVISLFRTEAHATLSPNQAIGAILPEQS